MSDFKPGVDAARRALGNKIPIVHRVHPGGAQGVRISLQEVADRIKKGRNDPRVRAWAIRAIHEAGGPQDTPSQAQAILTALKKASTYVQDPVNTEFMQAAHETLCLDDKGLCFRGGDCDDLVVAYGSATLSVGINTQIIGEMFNGNKIPSHVLAAIQDNATGDWLRVDPSTDKPVGQYVPGSGEQWLDPMTTTIGVGGKADTGDFVGVGRIPGALAATSAAPASSSTDAVLWIIGAAAVVTIGAVLYERRKPVAAYDDQTGQLLDRFNTRSEGLRFGYAYTMRTGHGVLIATPRGR